MRDLFEISGRTALVTGSTRGLGRTLARGIAEAGCRIVVHGRNVERSRAVAREIEDQCGVESMAVAFDVTVPDEVAAGVDQIESRWGPLDILVNNVGIQRRASFPEFKLGDWNDLIASNLTSAFLVSQRVVRGMLERHNGKIVNVGSVQCQLARPGITPYAATKGGIAMLTRGMCADLAGSGIQVNALAPGYFVTDMTQSLVDDADFSAWIEARTPARRWGRPEDLVGTLRFLVSDASVFVNGQIIYVDGGITAVA